MEHTRSCIVTFSSYLLHAAEKLNFPNYSNRDNNYIRIDLLNETVVPTLTQKVLEAVEASNALGHDQGVRPILGWH
jgi:hypothetical protein